MEINKIYNECNTVTMAKMPSSFIDLTITSPPYDKMRKYNGFDLNYDLIIKELFRVTKSGGVVVWVVGDQVVGGSETGSSFRQALKFIEAGFFLHDTMIYEKDSISFPETNRYSQIFEFMFVFSKGKPKTVNILKDRKNKFTKNKKIKGRERQSDGQLINKRKGNLVKEYGARFNIWRYSTGKNKSSTDTIAFKHPAIFPEKLVADHIYSWSNEGDLIYDCFGGSGTTVKIAHLMKRNWVMSEISEEYCNLSAKRISPFLEQTRLL